MQGEDMTGPHALLWIGFAFVPLCACVLRVGGVRVRAPRADVSARLSNENFEFSYKSFQCFSCPYLFMVLRTSVPAPL